MCEFRYAVPWLYQKGGTQRSMGVLSVVRLEQDPQKSCKMIDTKNADLRILVRTNFREVCPDFI